MDETRTILIILSPGKAQRRQGSVNFVAIGGGDRVEVFPAENRAAHGPHHDGLPSKIKLFL